jgi:hypothetical protein
MYSAKTSKGRLSKSKPMVKETTSFIQSVFVSSTPRPYTRELLLSESIPVTDVSSTALGKEEMAVRL